jgi:gluconolactonase
VRRIAFAAVLGFIAAVLSATAVPARDPVALYPGNYTVLFENDRVRVVDFRLKKGATEESHAHPAHVAVFLADFTIRFTLPGGATAIRHAHAGEVAWSEATEHASENIGSTDAHGILFELKTTDRPTSSAPAAVDPTTAVTLIHGIPGHDEELKEHLLSLAGPTRAEPGCRRYDLYQSTAARHEFMRFEEWESIAALEAHKRTPHLRSSFEKRQREGWTTQILTFNRVPDAPGGVAWIERLDPRLDRLIPPGALPEKVADGIEWAEGPVWSPRDASLLFSDVPRNAVMRWSAPGGIETYLHGSGYTGRAPFAGREPGSNGLVFDPEGRLVMCQHGDRRVVRREDDGGLTVLADRFEGRRLNSPNDLVFDSRGDLYFTDPPFGLPGSFADPARELPFQGVFRLTRDGTLRVLVTDLRAPNGIAFSPDERTLYVSNADHARPVWMAYPVAPDGALGPGREFAEARAFVRDGEGVPDGLKVDREGNVFAAGPGGIHVFAPDGTRLGRIVTGVPTGNLNWGEDGSVLYIAADHAILRLRTATSGTPFPTTASR